MLSRVADSLYWMSRYIERAENTSRLLDVNLQLMLDFEGLDDSALTGHWEPILNSSGNSELFRKLYTTADSRAVTEFITFNPENPNSILSCINNARENARMVRDQISAEMWEVINDTYHKLRNRTAESIWEQGAYQFYEDLKNDSLLFQGHSEATFTHDQGYKFLQVGKYLERADQTSRIIDIKHHMVLPGNEEPGGAVDIAQWMAVLRGCSAFEAYHHRYVEEVQHRNVTEFLILSPNFPRSIRFCLSALDYHMRSITFTAEGQFSNQAEQLSGRIRSEIIYTTIDEILDEGLNPYLDRFQQKLIQLNNAILESYVYQPAIDLSLEIEEQQQQQQ